MANRTQPTVLSHETTGSNSVTSVYQANGAVVTVNSVFASGKKSETLEDLYFAILRRKILEQEEGAGEAEPQDAGICS